MKGDLMFQPGSHITALPTLLNANQSRGFICGKDALQHWNPLEICHLLHRSKDYYGVLADLVPAYTRADVIAYPHSRSKC